MASTIAVILLMPGCSSAAPGTGRPSAAVTTTASQTPCTPGDASSGSSPEPARTIGAGKPPSAPVSVELTAGPRADEATVRAIPAPRETYDAVQLRIFVNGCEMPYTDEGDELPTQTISGLRSGDRLEVLARFDGEGGNSAETRSSPIILP